MIWSLASAVIAFVALLLAASEVNAAAIVGVLIVAAAAVVVPVAISARKLRGEREKPREDRKARHAGQRTRVTVQQGASLRKDEDWFLYEFTITPTGPGDASLVRAVLVYQDTDEMVTDERVDVSDFLRAREPRRVRLRVPNDLHEQPERIGRSITVRIEWEDGDGSREEAFGPSIEVGGPGIRRR
jgi:hypothetical protein